MVVVGGGEKMDASFFSGFYEGKKKNVLGFILAPATSQLPGWVARWLVHSLCLSHPKLEGCGEDTSIGSFGFGQHVLEKSQDQHAMLPPHPSPSFPKSQPLAPFLEEVCQSP